MPGLMLVVAHVQLLAWFMHEWSYHQGHGPNYHSYKKEAGHNPTHEDSSKEEEDINYVSPCQDWEDEDEAKISCHVKGWNYKEEDEAEISRPINQWNYKERKAEPWHDR